MLTLVMGAVLIAGFRLATELRASVAALETASMLQAYPDEISQRLGSLRDRLEARLYAGQASADLSVTARRFGRDLKQLGTGGYIQSVELEQAQTLWREYTPIIDPVINFTGQPYVDSDDSSSTFSKEGRAFYADVKRAQLFTNENAKRLQGSLAAVATALERSSVRAANSLRELLFIGVAATFVLATVAAYFQRLRARHESAARAAQEQTRDILRTVREGFFLLDADYRIGTVWSGALTQMFGRDDFAGLAFEELLQDLVPAATLTTAMKYIKLLWGDRAHENLMKSINPLGQLEITMENQYGGKETRYLQFDFHRVMGHKGVIKDVLCSVADITSSVLLARELQESQENANSQLDMMLGMMHVDPDQLTAFLDATETGLRLINSIMKEPARTDAEFRKKLAGLFRELHSIKGEASALNLMSIAQRVHALEDMVSEMKKKPEISGNDFLPMVLKLDDLMAHLRGVREMATRLSALKAGTESAPPPERLTGPTRGAEDLSPTLQAMAERLAQDHRKRFRLSLNGLTEVPNAYFGTVKDCLIQMLRNAAVHGIEPSEVRRAQTKDDVGAVRVEFRRGSDCFELTFEDDGAGISPDTLKAAAVRRQIISPEEAATMDTRAAMALIFRPGFSTQEEVSMDAGRGVGMDVVARSVYALGGKIGVSTNPGKFTRFKIVLPAVEPAFA
jgi:signal transduction histidine kinase